MSPPITDEELEKQAAERRRRHARDANIQALYERFPSRDLIADAYLRGELNEDERDAAICHVSGIKPSDIDGAITRFVVLQLQSTTRLKRIASDLDCGMGDLDSLRCRLRDLLDVLISERT